MAESTNLNNINIFQSEEQYLENKNNLNTSDINLVPQINATVSEAGLMSANDKSKLDGIDNGANAYTHPSYTARTGKPDADQTPAFGGTATVSQITSDVTGHVTGATDRTIKIPSTLSNGAETAGLIKTTSTVTSSSGYTACPVISGVPYYKDTDTKNPSFTTTVSTQAGIAPSFSKSGQTVTLQTFNTVAGIAAGTYTLSNILQKLINASHTHAAKNITFVDDLGSNCDCNCDCNCSGCMH